MSGIRRMLLSVEEAMGVVTVYWIREGASVALHVVMATRPEGDIEKVNKALASASRIAGDMGFGDAKKGAFMHGNGRGGLEAVGVAEMPWSRELESELLGAGFVEVR